LPRFLFDHGAAPAGTGRLFADTRNPWEILAALAAGSDIRPGVDPEDALAELRKLSLLQLAAESAFGSEGRIHRVLAIDEEGLGAEHPTVAIGLNNLAGLLHATNRLDEADPPMRRHLVIFLLFFRQPGYPHTVLGAAFEKYWELLAALSLDRRDTAADRLPLRRGRSQQGGVPPTVGWSLRRRCGLAWSLLAAPAHRCRNQVRITARCTKASISGPRRLDRYGSKADLCPR